jgi:hypothetical protein
MAYGETAWQKVGIINESECIPILNRVFQDKITFIPSSKDENMRLKVDYWGIVNGEKRYAFDFKSSVKPWERFCLTYKMAHTTQNVFEVGISNITTIFFLSHEKRFAFIPKKEIHKWFLENKPELKQGRKDDSNYFEFSTEEIIRLATYFKEY